MANVAELPLLPPSPCGLSLTCSSLSFIDSALLKGHLLLTRHNCCSGAQLFPGRSFVPLLAWNNRKVGRVSAFKAESFGQAVGVPTQGSSSVKYYNKSESGGWEECISA